MPLLPVTHFTWQLLRAVKRSKKPLPGRTLRLTPTRSTKDGTFLTDLVEQGLLSRVTGTADEPFEATYTLTEQGEYAAEYGECEMPVKAKAIEPPASKKQLPAKKGKSVARRSR